MQGMISLLPAAEDGGGREVTPQLTFLETALYVGRAVL